MPLTPLCARCSSSAGARTCLMRLKVIPQGAAADNWWDGNHPAAQRLAQRARPRRGARASSSTGGGGRLPAAPAATGGGDGRRRAARRQPPVPRPPWGLRRRAAGRRLGRLHARLERAHALRRRRRRPAHARVRGLPVARCAATRCGSGWSPARCSPRRRTTRTARRSPRGPCSSSTSARARGRETSAAAARSSTSCSKARASSSCSSVPRARSSTSHRRCAARSASSPTAPRASRWRPSTRSSGTGSPGASGDCWTSSSSRPSAPSSRWR